MRQFGFVAKVVEQLEDWRAVFRLDEDVDVLRVARDMCVMRERKRPTNQERNAGVEQLGERVDVEVGGWIIDRSGGRGSHGAPQDAATSVDRRPRGDPNGDRLSSCGM